MGAHEICKIEPVLCLSYEKRRPFLKAGYRLSRKIVVGQQSAAIPVPLHCLVIKYGEELILINRRSDCSRKFIKNINPCIQIGGAVITVYHSNQCPVRRCNQINFRIDAA